MKRLKLWCLVAGILIVAAGGTAQALYFQSYNFILTTTYLSGSVSPH
jgi:hypothetical protein